MMIAKALSKSGRRILKAFMKFSKARMAKKLEAQQQQWLQQQQQQQAANNWQWRASEEEAASLDAKSVDTYLTYVPEEYSGPCCCCHCDERDENQRNENLENEMMMC